MSRYKRRLVEKAVRELRKRNIEPTPWNVLEYLDRHGKYFTTREVSQYIRYFNAGQ